MNVERLKALFEKSKDKYADAREIGTTYQTIYNILYKGSNCKVDLLKKIADFYKVPIGYFFDEELNKTIISGDKNQIGNGNVIIDDCPAQLNEAKKEIEHLKQIIAEKERLIQVLLNK